MTSLEQKVAGIFMEMADGIETGSFGKKPRIALTGMGSEHAAARAAAAAGVDVVYIGSLEDPAVETVAVADDEAGHEKMDEMLSAGEIDGAVTMHYPFPIGVSTVGRVVTPAVGKEMFIANTTGTSSTERVEAMILNAIAGIIAAKACGIAEPTVGILNVDSARQVEMALKELQENGYGIKFAESSRADGGCVLRGNDVLKGTPDVLVTDSLTGNVLTKMISAFNTGGSFEATGFGYGPGIGEGYDKLVLIVSRASGAPVLANALKFAGELVKNKVFDIAKAEYAAAKKAGLEAAIEKRKPKAKVEEAAVTAPPAEPCTSSIPGIDVIDLEDAVQLLWKNGIYAESGMGCTGPLVMMSDANFEKSKELLKEAGYIG